MEEILSDLLKLLDPASLRIELILLVVATICHRILAPSVREALQGDFPVPAVVWWWVGAAFGIGIPVAIVSWFISILFRYL